MRISEMTAEAIKGSLHQEKSRVPDELLGRIYRSIFRIRRVEERIIAIYASDKIKSPVHLSIGQEAVSVGACEALRPTDVVFGTYRSHALYLAKGGDLKAMIAELYGKRTGCGKGKAGSMHLACRSAGMMGTSAIVGTTIPQAVGYALAEKHRGKDTVVVAFFGDGAMEEGAFHESINFAAVKRLPVIFICENNFYAIHTPLHVRVAAPNYCERAESYKVPATRIENNDVLAIYDAISKATVAIRGHAAGPVFLEVQTYRWREHVGPNEDWHLGFRTREEGETWIKRDEMVRIGGMLHSDARRKIERQVTKEIEAAFAYAEESNFPGREELYDDVFRI